MEYRRRLLVCCASLMSMGVMTYLYAGGRLNNGLRIGRVQKSLPLNNTFDLVDQNWNLNITGDPVHLMCDRFLKGDSESIKAYVNVGRITTTREPNVGMDCASIQRRILSPTGLQANKSIAFARNVFTGYYLQETLLSFDFSPQNVYCYALDRNSSDVFKMRMRQMASCFSNVFALEKEFAFDSGGHFQDHGHFACIQQLLRHSHWDYVLLLQNHDVVLRTNAELSAIVSVSEGAQIHGHQRPQTNRYDSKLNWTAGELGWWKRVDNRSQVQMTTKIEVVKSLNENFLSRDFVASLNEQLRMDVILDQFNVPKYYGVDEMLMSTLALAYHFDLPGQSSQICYETCNIVRFTQWNFGNPIGCPSRFSRHGICILGVEYLQELSTKPQIIANKVLETFDFGALLCLRGMVRKRSAAGEIAVELEEYRKLPQVRERKLRREGNFNADQFKC